MRVFLAACSERPEQAAPRDFHRAREPRVSPGAIEIYRGYEIIADGLGFQVALEGTAALASFSSIEEARAEIDGAEAIWAEWGSGSAAASRVVHLARDEKDS